MPKAYKLTGKIKLDLTKPILLSLDAFGTIYHPKQTIVKTYIKYAKKYGLRNLDQKVVSEKFTEAFEIQRREFPLYGANDPNMTPKLWWEQVVRKTFAHHAHGNPRGLIDKLYHVFSCEEGYRKDKAARRLFDTLSTLKLGLGTPRVPIRVGVITNSDPRVPRILTSLGLNVMARRYEENAEVQTWDPATEPLMRRPPHIDFVVTSYDVRSEKPKRKMFDAALAVNGLDKSKVKELEVQRIHVGDDGKKDYDGALEGGWQAIQIGDITASGMQGRVGINNLDDLTAFLRSEAKLPQMHV